MRQVSRVPFVEANDSAAISCHGSSSAPPPDNRGDILPRLFALMCADLWKVKAPANLRFWTKRSERTCRAWVSGENEPGFSIGAMLLRGDEGWRVLKFIMRGSTATWWLNVQHGVRVAEAIRNAEGE